MTERFIQHRWQEKEYYQTNFKDDEMKILMYGWEYPPNINGGLGIATHEIVHALLKQQMRVALILPHTMQAAEYEESPQNTSTLEFEKLHIQCINSILQPYMDPLLYQQTRAAFPDSLIYGNDLFGEVMRYAHCAGQLGADIEHDIIHAHDWLTIRAGMLAKTLSQKPLFFHVHSLETDRAEHVHPTIYAIEKEGLQCADKIIAVSEFTKQAIIKHYDIHPDKIFVAHNGVPQADFTAQNITTIKPATDRSLATYSPADSKKFVLFLGRITHQKGPFYFLEAAQKILSRRQDIHFLIAGEGDLLPRLMERVTELKMNDYVHFLGFLDREQVRATYEQSHVYVMPSVSEPFGLTCLEALTLNVPLVLSNQTGISEALPHVLKADYWDTSTMAEKIMALIDYPSLRLAVLRDSQADLARLTWDNTAQTLIHHYHIAREN